MKKLVCIVLAFAFMQQSYAQVWSPTAKADMPAAISNNAVVAAEANGIDYVYSFGGIGSGKTHEDIVTDSYRYNTSTDTWESIADLPDDPKIASGASVVKNKIYIIGGYYVASDGTEVSSEKIHCFDPETNSYLQDGAPIPVPIDDQVQAVWRDSLIYVVTGWSQNINVTDVQIYNPTTDEWLEGTSLPTSHNYRSFGSSGVILNDTIYYFGGARIGTNFPVQANLRKGAINPENPTEIEWTESIVNPDFVGYRMAATVYGQKIFWIGGSEVTYNFDGIAYNGSGGVAPANRALVYDTETGEMSSYPMDYPMDLRGIADVSETQKYLVGGMLADQEVSNACWELNYNPVFIPEYNTPEWIVNNNGQLVLMPYSNAYQWECYALDGRLVASGKQKEGHLNINVATNGIYIIAISRGKEVFRIKSFL